MVVMTLNLNFGDNNNMLKTLKITTFLVAILAVGCVAALGYYAFKKDADAINLLDQQSQVEEFIASAKAPKQDDATKDSPLVKQAEKFALRIDPPPPPPPLPSKEKPGKTQIPLNTTVRHTPPPSAKFTLSGTVVSANPEYSIALLNTTAKGLRWFRQGEKIGHLTIEQIGEGFVVINDGTKTYEMQAPKKQRISLLKGDPDNPYSKTKNATPTSKTINTIESPSPAAIPRSKIQTEVVQTSPGEVAIVQKKVAPPPSSESIKENIKFLEQIANDPESMGMTKEDAAQMGDLTDFIQQLNAEFTDAQKREAKDKTVSEPNQPKEKPASEPNIPNQTSDKTPPRKRRPRRTRTR